MMIEKLILGSVQFGLDYGINSNGRVSSQEAHDILTEASQAGVRFLDTARVYGGSEEVIGEYVSSQWRNPFSIISKLKLNDGQDWKESLKTSLINLKLERLDGLMFHSFDDYVSIKKSFYEEIKTGSPRPFKKLGVSVYTNEEIFQVLKDPNIEFLQVPFNLLDNQSKRGKVLKECHNAGKEVHVRSVFLQGLFFMSDDKIPDYLRALLPYLHEIRQIAYELEMDLGELALQYALSKDYIDGVLIGVDSLAQFKQNLEWVSTPVQSHTFDALDQISVIEEDLIDPRNWNT